MESKLLHADTIVNIKSNLREKKDRYDILSDKHSRMGMINRIVYYALGGATVLLTVVCSGLSAALSSIDPDDTMALAIFVLSLTATIFGSIVNFFGIEEKIGKHNQSKVQYKDMSREIDVYLLSYKGMGDLIEDEKLLLEREKFIAAYEPSVSPCCV